MEIKAKPVKAGDVSESPGLSLADSLLASVGGETRRVSPDVLAGFPTGFPTIPLAAAATTLKDSATYRVNSGWNGQPEDFTYDAGSTLSADGALIVDATGMGAGRLISKRTTLPTVAAVLADGRLLANGVYVDAVTYRYLTVSSGFHLTTAGGTKLRHQQTAGKFHLLALAPNADGVTDDKAKIDLLNLNGYGVDLGGKSYRYTGVFAPAANFTNGQIIDNNRTYDYRATVPATVVYPARQRARLNYYTGNILEVFTGSHIAMNGFKMFGNSYRTGPIFKTPAYRNVINKSLASSFGAQTSQAFNNWYGVFAVADRTDTVCRFLLMPFIRVKDVLTGFRFTLGYAGESATYPLASKSYAWSTGDLDGAEILVITTSGGAWNGRVETITGTSAGSLDITSTAGLAANDFLLPEPPNVDYCAYLGAHYVDAAEWRNIGDSGGQWISIRGTALSGPSTSGLVDPSVAREEISFAGHIDPLATGARFRINNNFSTAVTGNFAQYFSTDSAPHDTAYTYWRKTNTSSETNVHDVQVYFSKKQSTWYSNAGPLAGSSSGRQFLMLGHAVAE